MTVKELGRLFRLDEQSAHKQSKMQSKERKLLYLVAMYTGLRSSELASLTRSSFTLEGDSPTIQIHAKSSKRGKYDRIHLHPDLVKPLRQHVATFSRMNQRSTCSYEQVVNQADAAMDWNGDDEPEPDGAGGGSWSDVEEDEGESGAMVRQFDVPNHNNM